MQHFIDKPTNSLYTIINLRSTYICVFPDKKNSLTVLNTGDFFDFLSEGNFRYADRHLPPLDCIYAAGNHDFCHRVGKVKEDYEYKWEMINKPAPPLPNNLYFYSSVINGVNIVTLDNSYYLITEGQLELLKAEVELLRDIHTVIFEETLCRGKPQIFTHDTFAGFIREIVIT